MKIDKLSFEIAQELRDSSMSAFTQYIEIDNVYIEVNVKVCSTNKIKQLKKDWEK